MVATASRADAAPAGPPQTPAPRRFTADEFERLLAAAIVREGERVELLGGEIVCMAAMASKHAASVRRLDTCFHDRVGGRAIVSVQCPIRLAPRWEPEPDLALLLPRADGYEFQHPGPEDVRLLIEVSDTSFAYDRHRKLPRYAAAGIPEVWIWHLPRECALVCRNPEHGRYTEITELKRGDTITPLAFPDLSITVDEILG